MYNMQLSEIKNIENGSRTKQVTWEGFIEIMDLIGSIRDFKLGMRMSKNFEEKKDSDSGLCTICFDEVT